MTEISANHLVAFWVEQDPDAPWIIHEEPVIGRGDFERRKNRLARVYADLGVRLGDLVTIALPNGIEIFEANLRSGSLARRRSRRRSFPPADEDDLGRSANHHLRAAGLEQSRLRRRVGGRAGRA